MVKGEGDDEKKGNEQRGSKFEGHGNRNEEEINVFWEEKSISE